MNSFKRNKNPLNTLNIGSKKLIIDWFNKWAPDVEYKIDDNLNIFVLHSLRFQNLKATYLPDNLYIKGDLNLNNNFILEVLPKNLNIIGNLEINNCHITRIPDDLTVQYQIRTNCTKLEYIPKYLKVKIH